MGERHSYVRIVDIHFGEAYIFPPQWSLACKRSRRMLLLQRLENTHRLRNCLFVCPRAREQLFVLLVLRGRARNRGLQLPHLYEAMPDVTHKLGRGHLEDILLARPNTPLEMPEQQARRHVPPAHHRHHIRPNVLDGVRVVDVTVGMKIHSVARKVVCEVLLRVGSRPSPQRWCRASP